MATHLAASGGRSTQDYGGAIDRLGEMRVLPPEFAATLRPLAGFRNVLVHGYLEVDVAVVVRLLGERLEDFAAFAAWIGTWRRREGERDRTSRETGGRRLTLALA